MQVVQGNFRCFGPNSVEARRGRPLFVFHFGSNLWKRLMTPLVFGIIRKALFFLFLLLDQNQKVLEELHVF